MSKMEMTPESHPIDGLTPIDVWLRFDDPEAEEADYEANTFRTPTGFVIEWYHNAVGLVSQHHVTTYAEAEEWYAANGYDDFTA